MPSSSVPSSTRASSDMARLPMTIEALHNFVDDLASRDSVSSDFIGPIPNTSRFLREEIHITEGLSSETAHPIVVRCMFPPNTQSRHAVIHMKTSMFEEALASKLYETFDIAATGGVITNSLSVWIRGLCPFNNTPGAPTLITGAGNLVSARNFGKGIEQLGITKCGIIELVVIPEQQFALCPRCHHQGVADAAMLQHVRTRCIDVRRLCIGCLQQWGFPPDVDEVILPGEVQVQAIRG